MNRKMHKHEDSSSMLQTVDFPKSRFPHSPKINGL